MISIESPCLLLPLIKKKIPAISKPAPITHNISDITLIYDFGFYVLSMSSSSSIIYYLNC